MGGRLSRDIEQRCGAPGEFEVCGRGGAQYPAKTRDKSGFLQNAVWVCF
jgi:hypothetical protein